MSHKQSTVLVHNLNEPTNQVDETEQHFLTVEAKFAMTLISVAFMDPPKKTDNITYFLECEKLPTKRVLSNWFGLY
jgi:hypothetical protein